MVPFDLLIELNNIPVSLQVEQLDYLADEHGSMHYDVRINLRQAVVLVNIEDDPKHPDFSFEAIQAIEEDFTGEELLVIVQAIYDHNHRVSLPLNQLPLFKN
ncbi:hypothetical protein AB6735_03965 [Mucilaginibacter sp. RCC_168]|uniref:hypothetical protein n=1 Tax=Mucilaginibacter sp. RCC_168 TaxID=3239221 RepID=UPI00352498CA